MTAYLASNLWAIWTAIAIICLIIELGSGDFFLTCFDADTCFCNLFSTEYYLRTTISSTKTS